MSSGNCRMLLRARHSKLTKNTDVMVCGDIARGELSKCLPTWVLRLGVKAKSVFCVKC